MTGAPKSGDQVTIYRLTFATRPMIEGRAKIIHPHPGIPDLYSVTFDGDPRPRDRFVHAGNWQADPARMLAALIAHWRASLAPETYGDFSPYPNADWPERSR